MKACRPAGERRPTLQAVRAAATAAIGLGRPFALALAAMVALAVPAPATAGSRVELQPQPTSHGSTVTLGDLFAGADGAVARIVVARVQAPGLQTVLDADGVQARARSAGLDWSNARGLHQIIVASAPGDDPPRSEAASRRHGPRSRAAQALVYARNLMAGEIVGAADLQWSSEAVAASDSPADPSAVVGKAARWALRAGAPVETRELDNPKVVRRSEMIDVAFQDDGVTLVLQAKALSDAAVGDAVEVMNTQSKKVIEAVVSGPGQAVVGPQAEAIKAAAFDPAIHTASLR